MLRRTVSPLWSDKGIIIKAHYTICSEQTEELNNCHKMQAGRLNNILLLNRRFTQISCSFIQFFKFLGSFCLISPRICPVWAPQSAFILLEESFHNSFIMKDNGRIRENKEE